MRGLTLLRMGSFDLNVTELGILYQNRPEHEVKTSNREARVLAVFSGRF